MSTNGDDRALVPRELPDTNQTEAAIYGAMIAQACGHLAFDMEALEGRFKPIARKKIAFVTGLPEYIIARVMKSREYKAELALFLEKLRDNPATEFMYRELNALALKGFRILEQVLDDDTVSLSKRAEISLKLIDRRLGFIQGAGAPATNLIQAEVVNVLAVGRGMTDEEAETLKAVRDRFLRGDPTPSGDGHNIE